MKCRVDPQGSRLAQSLSSWRAWIEMSLRYRRGSTGRSLSSWRAWIEIESTSTKAGRASSLSSWRAWIEICGAGEGGRNRSRSPHGERGLKSRWLAWLLVVSGSLSSWRAWIEIAIHRSNCLLERSLSSWRAWIEITRSAARCQRIVWSLSSWRAWIEMCRRCARPARTWVALLMESVD